MLILALSTLSMSGYSFLRIIFFLIGLTSSRVDRNHTLENPFPTYISGEVIVHILVLKLVSLVYQDTKLTSLRTGQFMPNLVEEQISSFFQSLYVLYNIYAWQNMVGYERGCTWWTEYKLNLKFPSPKNFPTQGLILFGVHRELRSTDYV